MKIEKMKINEKFKPTEDDSPISQILYETVTKINTIIDALSCQKCGNIKGLVGPGICFPCDEEEEEKHHKK